MSIASSITGITKIQGNSILVDQLIGESEINPSLITNFDEYCSIYKIRHDIIHAAICEKLGYPFGEKSVDEVLKSQEIFLDTQKYYEEVKKQTPDYLTVVGDVVKIIEVTVSQDIRAKNRKASKYALLCDVLHKAGFKLDFKIFVIHPQNVNINRDELIQMGLDEIIIDFIDLVCKNAFKLLYRIHKTPDGQHWYMAFYEISDVKQTVEFKHEDVLNTHNKMKNKCFHSEEDLKELLFSNPNPGLTGDDKTFIDFCVDQCSNIENPLCSKERFDVDAFYVDLDSKSNSKERKRTLPFPLMPVSIKDSSIRDTKEDIFNLIPIAAMMSQSSNQVMSELGHFLASFYNDLMKKGVNNLTNDDYMFVPHLSKEVQEEIALDGPNRKKYISKGSEDHLHESTKYNGYCLSPFVDISEIEQLSFYFSQKNEIKTTGDFSKDMELLSNLDGPGLRYVKFCQSIYREININAMRGDRRHKYVFKPTGCDGVFILIFPGTKLRSGELANSAWFKIVVDNEKLSDDSFSHHWLFKKVYRDRKISYSDWLSVDVHRLDHYIRAYDKIIMSYYSIITQKYKTVSDLDMFDKTSEKDVVRPIFSLLGEVNKDISNTLGMIILIYLEDKRSTSKMLQNIRYLVMTSISLYPKYSSVFEKMADPIRSPLQLYLLRQAIIYFEQMQKWDISRNVRFGSVKYDHKSHTFLDSLGGSVIKLPHPIITDPNGGADFSQILSEMYFTMLFNKNQDDPTHASFQILDKIIEGEENFKEVKRNNNHLGYRKDLTDVDFAQLIISKPKAHQFSRRAIEIGSKLLRSHLGDEVADHYTIAAEKRNMNKTLDEYATFKSSANLDREVYDPNQTVQNSRRKCVEGVIELLDRGLFRSYDVMKEYKDEDTFYHVFKKNQIGGVREILILPITNRIRINILETFSRNLCYFDKRESLTHGSTKNESLKAMLYNSKKLSGLRAPIHLTFDKSKWGPSFVPIQFIYMFNNFKNKMPGLFNFFVDLLIRHQNKKCVYPERLVRAWYNDLADNHDKSYKQLRHLKLKFIQDKKLTMNNESNMGQGILHYTSSLLHLCMITFRDTLYKKLCQRFNINHEDHEDILSSDDSYTMFCPELYSNDTAQFIKFKLKLFLQAQRISELLFNCRTSNVKSSINPFIGEFNSLFISNMTFMPTLFKFCLSSVHPVNTDSFYRMVKESFSSSRQIVENGGGLDLYLISAMCNKRYCESIYHTYQNGANDLTSLGINYAPYHVGYFPIFNPALMVIFGPEYYNYKLFKQHWSELTPNSRKLFIASHKIMKGDLINTLAEYEDGDTMLGGLLRIEAAIGPVRQLERIRSFANLTSEQISKIIEENPLIIIQKPKTIEDVMFKTTHKLYTIGSKEALKNLAASIFYGRVSASVSANAFYVPNGGVERMTYRECLIKMINMESQFESVEQQLKFLYPKHVDYEVFIRNDEFNLNFYARNPFEIQTIQTLVTHKIHTKLTQSVSELLEYKWLNKPVPQHLESKVSRDFIIIQSFYPMIKETFEETMNQFPLDEKLDKIKAVLLLVLRLFSLRERVFKGVIFGMGSQEITRTYETLLTQNTSSPTSGAITSAQKIIRRETSFDKIYCAYNHTILSEFADSKVGSNMWIEVLEEELISFFQDPSISRQVKKRIFMTAIANGFMNRIEDWSDKVGTIIHVWNLRQKYNNGDYTGDGDFTLFMGHKRLNVYFSQSEDKFYLSKMHLNDPQLLFEFIEEAAQIMKLDVKKFVSKIGHGKWVLDNERVVPTVGEGFAIDELKQHYELSLFNCKLEINDDRMILNDQDNYQIYSLDTGLLACNYLPSEEYDFKVFGLSFIKMCEFGSFTTNYNILYKSRRECLELLDDIEVERPKITEMTKERLSLGENWHLRIAEDLSNDVTIQDVTPDFATSFFQTMMQVDITAEEMKEVLGSELNEMDKIIEFLTKSDVIYSMKTEVKLQHARKLFFVIQNLKYDAISRLILQDMKINKHTLNQIRASFNGESRKNVMFSLISLYDRVYQTTTTRSPEGVILNIDEKFMQKFGLKEEMLSFDF